MRKTNQNHSPRTHGIILLSRKSRVVVHTHNTAAFSRQKQGAPEFLGHTENLWKEELHFRLLALIVIPNSLERERGGKGEVEHAG